MTRVTYDQIKPLVADASVIGEKMVCKFKDRKTGQVILSAAEIKSTVPGLNSATENDKTFFKTFLNFLSPERRKLRASQQETILRAFDKISDHFENKEGMIQLKTEHFAKDV